MNLVQRRPTQATGRTAAVGGDVSPLVRRRGSARFAPSLGGHAAVSASAGRQVPQLAGMGHLSIVRPGPALRRGGGHRSRREESRDAVPPNGSPVFATVPTTLAEAPVGRYRLLGRCPAEEEAERGKPGRGPRERGGAAKQPNPEDISMKKVRYLTLVSLAALSLVPAGAAMVGAQDDVVIGYSAPDLVGGQLDIQNSLVAYAETKGYEVLTSTSGGDIQQQVDDINNYIAQGVDAIVAVPDDSAGICTAVDAAKSAEIPFYTIDRSPQGCGINMTVLSDNYLAGQQSGQEVIRLLEVKYGEARGTVLEITGDLGQNVAQLRGGGFNDVVAEQPNIEVITETADWEADTAANIVRDIVSSEPELDAIYMHSDAVYTPGTLQVLEELGRLLPRGEEGHIFLAGVDGSPAALQAIRDGFTDQSSNQPVPDFGIVVNYIGQELAGQPVEEGTVEQEGALWSPARIEQSDVGPQLFLATTSVTPDNVDDPRLWANQQGQATPTP